MHKPNRITALGMQIALRCRPVLGRAQGALSGAGAVYEGTSDKEGKNDRLRAVAAGRWAGRRLLPAPAFLAVNNRPRSLCAEDAVADVHGDSRGNSLAWKPSACVHTAGEY